MIRPFIFLLTVALSSHAYGQYDYNEERQKEAQRFLENIKKGQEYSNTKSSALKMNQQAVQEMTDRWKRNAGKPTSPPLDDATIIRNWNLRQKEKAVQAAIDADASAKRDAIISTINQKVDAVYQTFLEDGFYSCDAKMMALNWVVEDKGEVKYVVDARSKEAAEAHRQYVQKEKIAGFDELLDLVEQFDVAGYTALKALEKLKIRFPEKTALLDLLMPVYGFNFYIPYGNLRSKIMNWKEPESSFMHAGAAEKAEMNRHQAKWLKENPAAITLLLREKYSDDKTFKELVDYQVKNAHADVLHDLWLGVTLYDPFPDTKVTNIRWATEETPYRQLLSFDDFEMIRKHHNISGIQAIEKAIGNRFMRTFHDNNKKATKWLSDLYTDELKRFGDMGDLEALNAYALLTYFEITKSKKENAYLIFKTVMDGGLFYPVFIMNDPKALKVAGIENFGIYLRELEFKRQFTKEEQKAMEDVPVELMPRFLMTNSFSMDKRLKISQPGGPQNTIYYYGDIKNGMANGFGRSVTPSNVEYKGYWKNNTFHGEGELNKTEIAAEPFKGIFLEGKKYGYYVVNYKKFGHFAADEFINGNKYKELQLPVQDQENSASYKGEVANGMVNGFGKAEFSKTSSYEGFWKDNTFNGTGILKYNINDDYAGEFKNGGFNGWGKRNFGNGRIYAGEWKDGEMTGYGSFSFGSGPSIEGFFIKGIPQFPNTPQRKNVTPVTASFQNWQEAVENFDWLYLQKPVDDKNVLRYFKDGLLQYNVLVDKNTTAVTALTGSEIKEYTFEATYVELDKKVAKGHNGLIIETRDENGKITRLYYLINPSKGEFNMSNVDAENKWTDFTSPGKNNGWQTSPAIKGYDKNGAATNKLTIKKRGTSISIYANDQFLFTQKTIEAGREALENFKGIGLVQSSFAQGYIPSVSFKEEGGKKK